MIVTKGFGQRQSIITKGLSLWILREIILTSTIKTLLTWVSEISPSIITLDSRLKPMMDFKSEIKFPEIIASKIELIKKLISLIDDSDKEMESKIELTKELQSKIEIPEE